jgi:hypothetical protein
MFKRGFPFIPTPVATWNMQAPFTPCEGSNQWDLLLAHLFNASLPLQAAKTPQTELQYGVRTVTIQ